MVTSDMFITFHECERIEIKKDLIDAIHLVKQNWFKNE